MKKQSKTRVPQFRTEHRHGGHKINLCSGVRRGRDQPLRPRRNEVSAEWALIEITIRASNKPSLKHVGVFFRRCGTTGRRGFHFLPTFIKWLGPPCRFPLYLLPCMLATAPYFVHGSLWPSAILRRHKNNLLFAVFARLGDGGWRYS